MNDFQDQISNITYQPTVKQQETDEETCSTAVSSDHSEKNRKARSIFTIVNHSTGNSLTAASLLNLESVKQPRMVFENNTIDANAENVLVNDDESIVKLENSVDNLIGCYHVNPFDGSLIKLSSNERGNDIIVQDDIELVKAKDNFDGGKYSQLKQLPCGRRKYRKRKYREIINQNNNNDDYNNGKSVVGSNIKPIGDKAEEVLKAAKSLFSKRTRTLYHWLYPTTSKLELKNIVISTWDTLQESEKHFYISQVLGRFGFPASNLMVNPQIEQGLQGVPSVSNNIAAVRHNNNNNNNDDHENDDGAMTKRVVEEFLADKRLLCNGRQVQKHSASVLTSAAGTELDTQNNTAEYGESSLSLYFVEDEEFENDPELNKEIVMFKMNTAINLNITDNSNF